jgi:predicted kinase
MSFPFDQTADALWLIAMRGLPGTGKSTLSRALGRALGWPVIDKDDCKDVLDGRCAEAGALAYEIMFRVARRQLSLGVSVICDSPLTFELGYQRAREVAAASGARLAVVECRCPEEGEWQRRIDGRKALGLPGHHQVDWQRFRQSRDEMERRAAYEITDPHLSVSTVMPLCDLVAEVRTWLSVL